tara:strand:+ start:891 stop:1412 length:522 start_codon:yes stop_codon:yes gene_type:complete
MKCSLKVIVLFLLLLTNAVEANINIAFIDMDKVLSESKPGSMILNQLKKKNNEYLKDFISKEKLLKAKETKLIGQKNILSDAEYELNLNQLKLDVDNYNKDRKKIISNFNKLKINNTNKFVKLINEILKEYSDKNSISLILQKKNLIIGKNDLDITDKIIKIVDIEITEFTIK